MNEFGAARLAAVVVLVAFAFGGCARAVEAPPASPPPPSPAAANDKLPDEEAPIQAPASSDSAALRPTSRAAAAPSPASASGASAPPATPEVTTAAEQRPRSESATPRAAALAAWDRARDELEAAAGDCVLACRALDSMERAVVRLCAIADGPEDRRRCDTAKKRLLDARDSVRRACGACPGGPSLDRRAPIPSR